MIVVTQGHEKGIGLEVFFKALSLGPRLWTNKCVLYAHKSTAKKHLVSLGHNFDIDSDGIHLPTGKLKCSWLDKSNFPASTQSFEESLSFVIDNPGSILFTLPTTKDDLRNVKRPSQRYLGHTEALRARFKNNALGMFFNSPNLNVLLVTDHLPLNAVTKTINAKFLINKLNQSLSTLRKVEPSINRAIISGLNPHAGEAGLLGKEEIKLKTALSKVKIKGIKLEGFYPGDTLLNHHRGPNDLMVYMHHDQGLAPFKTLMGSIGANITLGLPFIRLSVDHGTAFSLYGKNVADPRGASYCLRKALVYQERLSGQNPNKQSKSSQS